MKSIQYKFFALVFCFVVLSSNVFAQDSALKEKIQQMNNQMVKDMLADNSEAMLKMYADDAISLPSYEPMIKGKHDR
jgi:ketosteroid isomerase-like protein